MTRLRPILHRFRGLFGGRQNEAKMNAELRAHLDALTERNVAAGMSPDEARFTALRNFGGVEQIKERARDERRSAWGEQVLQDLRYALRMLRKNPGFTGVVVLTLALGIGGSTALFSVVDHVLLRPLPYAEPGSLVQVWEAPEPGRQNNVAAGIFFDWREQARAFEGLCAFANFTLTLSEAGEPERLGGIRMSANGLRLLRARPALGRVFANDEDQAGREKVVVLSHGLWQRRFGGDPAVVGRTLQLNAQPYTVIGVLPAEFPAWHTRELVIPHVFDAEDRENRRTNFLRVFGRLKPDVTPMQAQAELNAIAERSSALYPPQKRGWGATVVPLREQLTQEVRPTLLLLLGAVGLVLLIACANVANLLLARAANRRREIALRAALGASRGRIVRQLLVESVLLSLLGAALGLLVAFWSIEGLAHAAALRLPRADEIGLDLRVLGFALGAALLTGILFGLAPALQAARLDLTHALKTAGEVTDGRGRVRRGLIVAEVALALVLLVSAGLLLHSFVRLVSVPLGFEPRHVLHTTLVPPETKYSEDDAVGRVAFYRAIVEQLEALPGVEAAAFADAVPMLGRPATSFFTLADRSNADGKAHPVDLVFCTPEFFRVLGISLRRGRLLEPRDNSVPAPRVALINEAFARAHFAGEDPLGRTLRLADVNWEIVGLVADARHRTLAEPARPVLYRMPGFARWDAGNLVIRTRVPPLALVETVRQAIRGVEPQAVVTTFGTLEQAMAGSVAAQRFVLVLIWLFAAVALAMTAIGLYGVIAYAVAQRTREIGVRLALGASRRDVLRLVLSEGMKLTAIGVAVGLLAALGVTPALVHLLYETKPTDPLTLLSVSLALLIAALAASWLPARRAAKVDPMVALRSE